MSKKLHFIGLVTAAATLLSCDSADENKSESGQNRSLSAPPTLSVEPRALNAQQVELTIKTNLPTPIKVATSVELAGQKPDDIYIGYSEFVTLTGPTTKVLLDTSKGQSPLPAAKYEATVAFYPGWGAEGNAAAAGAPELHSATEFRLEGSGKSAASVALLNERQKWVMLNVIANYPWNPASFEKRLGKAVKGPSDLSHLHDAYYFAGADMTLIVNRLKNDVSVWRMGRATR